MEGSVWQGADGECAAALRCVFSWLRARELWRCAGVCSAWRAVALDDALWRRALRPNTPPAVVRAFAAAAAADRHGQENSLKWSWRHEFMLSSVRWERRGRLAAHGPLLHAALAPAARRLALLAEDASISIWEKNEGESWRESWSGSVMARGWRRAETAQWAAAGGRLLLAGPLALSDRWELAVLQRDDDEDTWRVVCRADAGAGGAACWASAAAFLTPRLQLLAPGLALTTVWLNTVSQEARSEYSGVTTPLLRIFNESAAHISHIAMTEMPSVPIDTPVDDDVKEEYGPRAEYYIAVSATNTSQENADRILVAAMGDVGGPRGESHALGAWRVRAEALRPPPLLAGAGLAERVRRRRLARALPDREESPPPDEDTVRALCTAPDDVCSLGAQVLGLVIHNRGSCIWVSTACGATCVTLPTLRRVLRVSLPHAPPPAALPHYVTPDVNDDFFVTPEGGGSGVVRVVAARSGVRGAALSHAAPALAALLPTATSAPASAVLLVLATDAIHIWEGTRLPL
ncbi:uncharacterized protein Fbw5 [Epargyreus clarus]|uniref:uncharacterized protein Fbw5 n=1 Tax=Epargyreus clarus TaxID=520877 RepID=UPI003C2FDAA7